MAGKALKRSSIGGLTAKAMSLSEYPPADERGERFILGNSESHPAGRFIKEYLVVCWIIGYGQIGSRDAEAATPLVLYTR
jgi:hypothetical protein